MQITDIVFLKSMRILPLSFSFPFLIKVDEVSRKIALLPIKTLLWPLYNKLMLAYDKNVNMIPSKKKILQV